MGSTWADGRLESKGLEPGGRWLIFIFQECVYDLSQECQEAGPPSACLALGSDSLASFPVRAFVALVRFGGRGGETLQVPWLGVLPPEAKHGAP